MICEMCGKDVPNTLAMMVEGSKLNLCPSCAKFGDSYRPSNRSDNGAYPSAGANRAVIEERLEKRERRMQTRDIYAASGSAELISDYGAVIRKARLKTGMSEEEFAKSINEKKGIILKVESQALKPDDKLVVKLEKALNIKLKEVITDGEVVGGNSKSNGMTLGNFFKVEKK